MNNAGRTVRADGVKAGMSTEALIQQDSLCVVM
jgi:hypothetical protein